MLRLVSFLIFAAVLMPAAAFADCVERQQDVRIDEHVASTIQTYRCDVGKGDKLEIGFYELSGLASGIVLGQSPALSTISSMFGPHTVAKNGVSAAYNTLFGAFSRVFAIGGIEGRTLFATVTGDKGQSDRTFGRAQGFQGNKVRAILMEPGSPLYYPVTREIGFLQQRALPPGMKFYYWVVCGVTDDGGPDCASYRDVRMVMWRGMTAADLEGYDAKVAYEKAAVTSQGIQTSISTLYGVTDGVDKYLQFVRTVAGDTLPDDFLTLEMSRYPEGCAGDAYWNYQFAPRDMTLRVAVIANISNRPVTLDALLGTAIDSPGLREAPRDFSPGAGGTPLDIGSYAIPPGGSLVVPLQIGFPAPKVGVETHQDIQLSNAYLDEAGAEGLNATAADYGFPYARDYAYGPEIRLSGVRANGQDVTLAPRSANFVELVASFEEGSCPYLLAWDQIDREWVDYGKVLHAAKGKARKDTEVVTFPGFQPRFRLEEREPEVASIDAVSLEVKLRDGRTETLAAGEEALAQPDDTYLRLFWDDAAEFFFELPADVGEEDVLESRLHITGFYRLYAEIKAAGAETGISIDTADSQAAHLGPDMCPARTLLP